MSRFKRYYQYSIIDGNSSINEVNVDVINYYFSINNQILKIDKDFKKIFSHFLIRNIINTCIELDPIYDRIFLYNKDADSMTEMYNYLNKSDYDRFVLKILKDIEKILPMDLIINSTHFDDISDTHIENDLLYVINRKISKRIDKSVRNLIRFAESLGLQKIIEDTSDKKLINLFL